MNRVALHTQGCRLNFSETGSLASEFVARGWEIVPFGSNADVTIINTCTVTDRADSTCRNSIRKALRSSPEGKTIVMGCYAQVASEEISKIEGVHLILGSSEKFKIFDYLDEDEGLQIKIAKSNQFWGAATTLDDYHTRAFLKIQDGCNYICSYCIIPEARGRSRAITIKDAIEQANKLVKDGYNEIVLTGVNVGEFEKCNNEKLSELIKRILDVKGLKRMRLSSVEPNTITKDILEIAKENPRFLNHFHTPMQSGSDRVLSGMRRRYNSSEYEDIISMIIDYVPTASIGADMIVGFPNETEEEFMETFNLASNLPITHFHVFPFSKRRNTLAAKMEGQIDSKIKNIRVKKLIELGHEKKLDFTKGLIGQTNKVLFERKKGDFWLGHTTSFLPVKMESNQILKNVEVEVLLKSIDNDTLIGTL